MTLSAIAQKAQHAQAILRTQIMQDDQRQWQARVNAQAAPDWRGYRDQVKAEAEKFNRAEAMGTQLERANAGRDFVAKREQLRGIVEGGAIGEHSAAITNLEAAGRRVDLARTAITNSYDSAHLSQELAVYTARISAAAQAGNLKELQDTYQEAQASGDKYKQRAAAIALQSSASRLAPGTLDSHGTDGRMVVNRMQHQAARDLEALKTSPALEAAAQGVTEAIGAMQAANSEIRSTAEVFGEMFPNGTLRNGNFINALARVQVHPDGSFETYAAPGE